MGRMGDLDAWLGHCQGQLVPGDPREQGGGGHKLGGGSTLSTLQSQNSDPLCALYSLPCAGHGAPPGPAAPGLVEPVLPPGLRHFVQRGVATVVELAAVGADGEPLGPHLCVANTHLYWDPSAAFVKEAQVSAAEVRLWATGSARAVEWSRMA